MSSSSTSPSAPTAPPPPATARPWRFASRFRPSTILPRRGSGEWTPALVILALLAALAAQLALPARTELPDDDGVAPRRPRPFAPAMIPAYPAILRAPIFAPDRAPGEARGPVSAAVAPPLQVLGVAGYGQAAGAVLRTADGAVQALKPGESLDGWRLVAVTPDAAVFAGPAGTARLVVGAKPDGATTSAPKTAPSSEPPP